MPKGYHHLTYLQRCQIEALRTIGISHAAIAQQQGCDRSAVYREIKRDSGRRGYRHKRAQRKATNRHREASAVSYRMTRELCAEIQERLREGWSAEHISGRFWLEGAQLGDK